VQGRFTGVAFGASFMHDIIKKKRITGRETGMQLLFFMTIRLKGYLEIMGER